MKAGLTGYKRKMRRNREHYKMKHRLGVKGLETRLINKATNKSNWFRKKGSGDLQVDQEGDGTSNSQTRETQEMRRDDQPITVLFVERSPKGGLITALKQKERELSQVFGNRVRMVEKSGKKVEHLICSKDL